MSHVFPRVIGSAPPPVAMRGEGPYLIDQTGKRYLDASGGAAVSCLGHSHPAVVAAICDQVGRMPYAHTGAFTNEPMEALADTLIADAPAGLDWVWYVSGGSEGVEAAIKMARQYFLEIGQPQRKHFIARRQSYHGNTLGGLSAGGNFWRREPYDPILVPVMHHIAPCYAYRDQCDGESEEAYGLRVADELEAKILELGPDTVAAFMAEPVVGATAGALPAVPGYFKRIREICDRHGVLLIFDEVMCGMGRTGTLYACEQEGVTPDLLIMAKGLGAGYQPIGAVLVADKVFAAFRDGSGYFQHGHTYMGHATACAGALAVQRVIKEEGLLQRVRDLGAHLESGLNERFGNHHHVGDIRGRGLFWAIELVEDRATKAVFDPGLKLHAKIKSAAFERGLMCYPMGGTIDGRNGDHVILAPPYNIDEATIDTIIDLLGDSVEDGLSAVS
ncbi:MAG: aspartate aminotransferase family protein [Rhodospirillaceae bacterium]|jgi:adenosylmethionine-8-amino-7-oxononanoate aminotransferase|nr:aspartate aminotransferase family protein [Rhodospirillaceae bacterium]MBT6116815.1 aspartate aminotransferase family protein [Rhodospirillaceae bacterium]